MVNRNFKEVFRRNMKNEGGIILIVLLCGIFLSFLAYLVEQTWLDNCQRLNSEGLSAFATVTNVEDNIVDGGFDVYYNFPIQINGRIMIYTDSVLTYGIPGIGRPSPGETMEVIYEADNPDHSAVKASSECMSPAFPIGMSILMFLIFSLPACWILLGK